MAFWTAQPMLDYANAIGFVGGVLWAFGASSLACAALTLWPYRTKEGRGNDMVHILEKLRRPHDTGEIYYTHNLALTEFGVGPQDWNASMGREVEAELKSTQSPPAVALCFLYALHRRDFDAARAIADLPLPNGKSEGIHHYLRAWADACERGDFASADAALACSYGPSRRTPWIMQVREMALIGILASDGQQDWAKRKLAHLKTNLQETAVTHDALKGLLDRALAGPMGAALGREI